MTYLDVSVLARRVLIDTEAGIDADSIYRTAKPSEKSDKFGET
jgi:hypothetical protein